jgi:hypothetical protein
MKKFYLILLAPLVLITLQSGSCGPTDGDSYKPGRPVPLYYLPRDVGYMYMCRGFSGTRVPHWNITMTVFEIDPSDPSGKKVFSKKTLNDIAPMFSETWTNVNVPGDKNFYVEVYYESTECFKDAYGACTSACAKVVRREASIIYNPWDTEVSNLGGDFFTGPCC